jgi:peptide/nickel transport system permease protein
MTATTTDALVPGGPVGPGGDVEATAKAQTWRAFRRNPLGLVSGIILLLLVVVGVVGPMLVGNPNDYGGDVLQPPSAAHWFGTDNLGRDILAEMVHGTRVSVTVAASASLLAILIGVTIAVIGAWFARLDTAVGLVVDLCLSLPILPLMILVAALAGPSLRTMILVIAFFAWPEVTRVVRSQALSVVTLPYMDAARLTGGSHLWIIRKHLVPAVAPVVIVSVVLTASRAVLSEAGLAFLGLSDPNNWSWGRVLYEAQQSGAMQSAWWTTLFPSLAILLLVVSASLLSIAYNDARNPRSQES